MELNKIGLQHYLNKINRAKLPQATARIFSEHKTGWTMISEAGSIEGVLMNTLRKKMSGEDELPKVGDWVEFSKLPGENKAKILKLLPRYSSLVRHLAKKHIHQTIATNIDIMFVVFSLDQIFNPSQLNRYLAIAQAGKITPIVVINKTDKTPGSNKIVAEILAIHPRQKILTTSTKSKIGISELIGSIKPGQTAVLVGNSGVGKSSLVNVLLAEAKQTTAVVSASGKGRHTTTSRQTYLLPSGGMIIDTPGMRTLEVAPKNSRASSDIFTELAELSHLCKYRNCDHIKSAGCALQTALQKKLITVKQLEQFLTLSTKHTQKINYNKSRN